MTMNRIFSLGVLACGVALILFGLSSADSISSSISRFFTGSPTDEAMWMLIGGICACVFGLIGLRGGTKKQS